MNSQTEALMSLIAVLLVLFSAMVDSRVSATLAVIALIAFSVYKYVYNFLPAVLLCALCTAWLFPSRSNEPSMIAAWKKRFQQHTASDWTWRLLLADVIFMPIYFLFGLMVVPFVGDYYQQGEFGLTVPPLTVLLLVLQVLLVRSVYFLVACMPVLVAWQGGRLRRRYIYDTHYTSSTPVCGNYADGWFTQRPLYVDPACDSTLGCDGC